MFIISVKVLATWLLLALTTLSSISAISLSDFYPFGTAAGDNEIPSTDDGSSELITLRHVFSFYESDNFVIVVRYVGHKNWLATASYLLAPC